MKYHNIKLNSSIGHPVINERRTLDPSRIAAQIRQLPVA